MIYSNEEIVIDYKTAKDKRKQLEILAQLNTCTEQEIIDILLAAGLSYKELPRKPRKAKELKAEKAERKAEKAERKAAKAEREPATTEENPIIKEEQKMPEAHSVENIIIEREEQVEPVKPLKPGREFYDMVARMWSAYLSGVNGSETVVTAEDVRVMNGVAVLMKR